MRLALLASLSAIALTATALGQPAEIFLPEINVPAQTSHVAATERCVDIQIGGSRAYDCINLKLRQQVDRINPSMNIPPIDARSSDIRVGVVNMPAVQQQYGRNFGTSVIPYRPALPTFSSPLGRR